MVQQKLDDIESLKVGILAEFRKNWSVQVAMLLLGKKKWLTNHRFCDGWDCDQCDQKKIAKCL